MVLNEIITKVQLVDGVFTPTEASDVVKGLIDEKINFHKIQRLGMCIGDECANTKFPDGRIGELMKEKEFAQLAINEARKAGKNISIKGMLEITFVD